MAKLLEHLPSQQHFKVFFDNWFCSIPLCLSLKENGFLITATIRADCTKGCPLLTDKVKQGRGSHCLRTDANSALCVTKWCDSKSVNLITLYIQPAKIETIKRCPKVVKEYNNYMGGVDLSDMLIALYRTNIKTKRWT